ncbi:MAG: hypothetical protein ABSA54_13300 [Terriglobales bacterium]|jgi:hypothetical protein
MHRRILGLVFACFFAGQLTLRAEDFKLFDREVAIHGFASQGFIYTNTNNWLTMNTSQGSAAFTDFGVNVSTSVTDKLRVGAQLYDRNLGQLGQYHPSLDWAVADYRFRSWFGIRGGKVKTTLGLYNDTQDLDFLRVFALLPQSVYPTDLRDATIAHLGGDVYGSLRLKHRLGDLSYTAYAGHRSDSIYSGYIYLASQYGLYYSRYGGLQYGGDLRWNTPVKGLLIGVSRMNEDITGKATAKNPSSSGPAFFPESDRSKADWANQFYGEYTVGRLRVDSEYRRFLHDEYFQAFGSVLLTNITDVRGWYVSGTYRVMKRFALGSYYSRYSITTVSGGPDAIYTSNHTDTSLPINHIYDKVVSARVDLKKFWNVKVEGHFMNGYGFCTYPDGFYPEVNPQGFKPNTNALVVKTEINF